MKNRRATGIDYEQKAAKYLKDLGYQIIEQNFRCKIGEIDLIAREGDYLVFVEVKYRTDGKMGQPQEAVDFRKQQKICKVASYYCMKKRISGMQACRFDVAACMGEKWTIIRDAFPYIC